MVDSIKHVLEEAQVAAFVEAADPSRLRVEVLALKPDTEAKLETRVEACGTSVHMVRALTRRDIGAFFRMRRRIRDRGYDVLHAHMPWAAEWGAMAARMTGIPLVATLYGPQAKPSASEVDKGEEDPARRALRRRAARIVALSGAQWDRYIQEGVFSRNLLEVIYQGVQIDERPIRPEQAQARREWFSEATGFSPGTRVCLTVADMDDWESGVDVLLWAVPEILGANPEARFLIVGEGEYREELERRVRARGLNKFVSWWGRNGELPHLMAESHLFIHPSLRDPFPVAALKAMAAGLPVVGTRVGGVPEIIGTSEAGRLVPRSDADALAEAVVELLRDPHALAAMGRAAHARAKNLFPVEGWVDRMERLYRTVLEEASEKHRPRSMTYARLNVELLTPREPAALVPSRPPRAQRRKMRYAGSSSSTS